MEELGKTLLLFGALMLIVGAAMVAMGKFSGGGHLPGDIVIQTENFSCWFPIVSSIVLSIVLTILLNLILRWLNR